MSGGPLHGPDAAPGIAQLAATFIEQRLAGTTLGRTATVDVMREVLAGAITASGLGTEAAWALLTGGVLANTIGIDSERFLAFIPVSPAVAASWADAIVGATSVPAESWLEAAGAVAAENQVLRLLADLADMPTSAGGCFMSGGSIGNLSALAVAREAAGSRRTVAVADTAHASVHNALRLLGLDSMAVPTAADGRLTGAALSEAVGGRDDVGIVVAAAGSTNAGLIDDLGGVADVAQRIGAWLHVDGAYGGATVFLPEFAERLRGLARADSFIVDPHKWLFAPAGSCALLYRDPMRAAAVHTQHGPYIELLRTTGDEWNPADFGFQLTRRAAGLPLWFALVLHGTDAFAQAIRRGIELARYAADAINAFAAAGGPVSLVLQPELSVVLFRRVGWGAGEWGTWARQLLAAGTAFVAPTTWRGEAVGRLVFMHPATPTSLVDEILATLVASES